MKQIVQIDFKKERKNVVQESFVIFAPLKGFHIDINERDCLEAGLFVAIYAPDGGLRFQKLMAYGKKEIGLSENGMHTTIGGIVGAIPSGKWTLVCGGMFQKEQDGHVEFVITDEEIAVEDPVGECLWMRPESGFCLVEELYPMNKVYCAKEKWYRGDFHTHTRLSDGKEPVSNAMKKAQDMSLDFYVATEHNLLHTGWRETSIMVLPGVEITTCRGHLNLFGITKRPTLLDELIRTGEESKLEEYMLKIVEQANEEKWLVSINHPFLHVWKWHLRNIPLAKVQCLEIINDPTYIYAEEANRRTVRFIDFLWSHGIQIYGVGGSDSHLLIEERYENATLPSIAGDPATSVHCQELSPNGLMENVRKGHMVVTRFCSIVPEIKGKDITYLPGDELKETEISYKAVISRLQEEPKVWLIKGNDKGVIIKIPLTVYRLEESYMVQTDLNIDREQYSWYRLEAESREGNFLGYVNPVFSGKARAGFVTFGEAIDSWEE